MRSSALALRELERDVQAKVYELLVKCGCSVYWMSQARETRQTPGVPDLMAFHALRGFTFIECKAPDGKQRKAQREFQELCELAGIRYILAPSVEPVRDWLGAKR